MKFKYVSDSMAVVSLTSRDLRTIQKALKYSRISSYSLDDQLETAAKELAEDHKIEASLLRSDFALE